MIKECVKEIIFEDGTISNIVSEVVNGLNKGVVAEAKTNVSQPPIQKSTLVEKKEFTKKIKETKQKLLDAIGKDAYGGVDLFEGTAPMTKKQARSSSAPAGPLADIAPSDPGVDIKSIPGFSNWKHLVK